MIGTVDNPDLAGKIICGKWYSDTRLQLGGMKILEDSKFTCSKCGFASRASRKVPHGYMIPVDLEHAGLAALESARGVCLCPLCASALAINWSVAEQRTDNAEILPVPGYLIWLPEMDQHKISIVASYVLVGVNHLDVDHDLADTLNYVNGAYLGRKAHLASNIPLYKDDRDSDFALALSLLPTEYYEYRSEVLKGVRYWPNANFWREQSKYWMHGTYRPIEESIGLLKGD